MGKQFSLPRPTVSDAQHPSHKNRVGSHYLKPIKGNMSVLADRGKMCCAGIVSMKRAAHFKYANPGALTMRMPSDSPPSRYSLRRGTLASTLAARRCFAKHNLSGLRPSHVVADLGYSTLHRSNSLAVRPRLIRHRLEHSIYYLVGARLALVRCRVLGVRHLHAPLRQCQSPNVPNCLFNLLRRKGQPVPISLHLPRTSAFTYSPRVPASTPDRHFFLFEGM